MMCSMKRDLKSANVNFEIVKYVVEDCLTNIKKKKKSRPKSAKITELGNFEIACKKTAFWEKRFWNLWTWFLGFFGRKLILKHFMHRTIPKRSVLGVFWTSQYVSEVYFTWRRLLLTLLTSFHGYNAFEGIFILLILKNQKKNPVTNSYILGIRSQMVFLSISAKNKKFWTGTGRWNRCVWACRERARPVGGDAFDYCKALLLSDQGTQPTELSGKGQIVGTNGFNLSKDTASFVNFELRNWQLVLDAFQFE